MQLDYVQWNKYYTGAQAQEQYNYVRYNSLCKYKSAEGNHLYIIIIILY